MTVQTYVKVPRSELVASLRARDGDVCQYPGKEHPLDFDAPDGSQDEVTIDHWYAQVHGKRDGWTFEEIWALSNLKLMCKRHNAAKGDLIPNEDGTLPEKAKSTFRFRRDRRATRVGLCEVCNNGHNLATDEVCASCGGNAQAFPRWAKVKATECLHDGVFWCWACSIGVVPMRGATETMLLGGEGGEG